MGKCSKTNGKTRYYGETIASDNVEELCEGFISTADVVPKSEVEALIKENEMWMLEYAGFRAGVKQIVEKAKTEVAREIFEEIEKLNHTIFDWTDVVEWDEIAKPKKKYTEDQTSAD